MISFFSDAENVTYRDASLAVSETGLSQLHRLF